MASVSQLLPLFRQLNDLKRIRVADKNGSIAQRLFVRSWARLVAGEPLETVALSETANAVVAAKLAGIDAQILRDGGVGELALLAILQRAFDAGAGVLPAPFAARLRAQISTESDARPKVHDTPKVHDSDNSMESGARLKVHDSDDALEFVELLARQPRAGATRPGHARVVLEPTENHAEHCAIVAVNCVLASSLYGADAGEAFLTGMSHHFHNAYLPDAGDAGDVLLGEYHAPLLQTFRERSIAQLPDELAQQARAALDNVFRADTPASKSFQVADSLDRVLEMEWHARSAEFTLSVALEEMDIIHPGPVQAFQLEIMRETGLK